MSTDAVSTLTCLYDVDETAWLENMAQLIAERRYEELDHEHLSEYLRDMARRDRRAVFSRLVVLLTHWLKWEYQPEKRSKSWRATIFAQRRDLRFFLESKTLRNYAEEILADAYEEACEQAAVETGLTEETFPARWERSVDDLLTGGFEEASESAADG